MSDYTPTLWDVKAAYVQYRVPQVTTEISTGDEFDRWLAAHDAEVRAGVVAEEPEWEYGWRDDRPVRWASGTNLPASFPKTVYPYESRPGLTRVRRRKAGPWVPVEQEGVGP